MRGISRKTAGLLIGLIEPVKHLVERHGQLVYGIARHA